MPRITPTFVLDDTLLDERFVRASGPGGQNVNKVSTAVELRLDLARAGLPPDVHARLLTLAGQRVTSEGLLIIESREHRTQGQNREAARLRLIALLQQAFVKPRPRRATRPSAGAKERRLTSKKRRSEVKAGRGRGTGNDD
ncbi:MAG: aminoacyl-tRNA hydrolase [Acidobacteria bacterium]|nr:aminoacyl-tRNA hydrolase [Acidobacteriota bacterium]